MNKNYDILIFLILIYLIIIYITSKTKEIKKYKFKTGDIILTKCFSPIQLLSKYTHASLIICILDRVYVLESYPDDNVRIITLDEYMEYYDKIYILSLKYRFSKEIEYRLFKNVKDYLDFKFPKFPLIYMLQTYIKSYLYNKNEKSPTHLVCSEFIYYIFENIEFIKDTYYLKSPDELLKLNTHTFLGYYKKYLK